MTTQGNEVDRSFMEQLFEGLVTVIPSAMQPEPL